MMLDIFWIGTLLLGAALSFITAIKKGSVNRTVEDNEFFFFGFGASILTVVVLLSWDQFGGVLLSWIENFLPQKGTLIHMFSSWAIVVVIFGGAAAAFFAACVWWCNRKLNSTKHVYE